jgi:hypothetical protein
VITPTEVLLTLSEGRYHQVKRMFAAVGQRPVFTRFQICIQRNITDSLAMQAHDPITDGSAERAAGKITEQADCKRAAADRFNQQGQERLCARNTGDLFGGQRPVFTRFQICIQRNITDSLAMQAHDLTAEEIASIGVPKELQAK